jgi:hypothetical protein
MGGGLLRVTASGACTGPYVVEAMCIDGRLALAPDRPSDNSATDAIRAGAGTPTLTIEEFNDLLGERRAHEQR